MITLRRLEESDLSILLKWLKAPHVHEFWDRDTQWTEELVKAKYGSYILGYKIEKGIKKKIHAFIILADQKPVGYMQFYDAYDFPREGYDLKRVLTKTDFEKLKLAAIDIFIGEVDALHKGIGSAAIEMLLHRTILTQFDCCLVDPDKINLSAIRFYEQAGFKRVMEVGKSLLMINGLLETRFE